MTTTESDTSTNEQQLRDAWDAFTDSLRISGAPPGEQDYPHKKHTFPAGAGNRHQHPWGKVWKLQQRFTCAARR